MVKAFAELNEKRDRIKVVFPYDREAVFKIKKVPGYRFIGPKQGGPHWLIPLDLTSAQILREQFGEYLELGNAVKKWGNKTKRKYERMEEIRAAEDAKLTIVPEKIPGLAKLYRKRKYQRADVAFMSRGSCINANQPGLGKTVEAIGAVYESELEDGPIIVCAPKTSLEVVWLYELDRWLPEDIPVFLCSGDDSRKTRSEMFKETAELHENGEPFWLVTTPSMIRFEVDKEATKKNQEAGIIDGSTGKVKRVTRPVNPALFEIEWNVGIFDEYHKMGLSNPDREKDGTPKTMLGKGAHFLDLERKFLMSGTPMGGRPIKLWAALNFLDPSRFTSKWRWADEWLEIQEDVINQSTGETAKTIMGLKLTREEEFNKHLAPYMVRRTKKEVAPQLPDKQIIHILCDMTRKQKEQYTKMAMNAEVKIEEESLTATSILAEYTRLKQFADAHQTIKQLPPREEGSDPVLKLTPTTDSGKLPHIEELLAERGISGDLEEQEGDEQVIIGSQFSQVVDMVTEWLIKKGIPAEKITGGVTGRHRADIVRKFQAGEARVLVMSTTAGGVAITLDKASTCIHLDETWDPDDQEQFQDRGHGRQLEKAASDINKLTVYYLRSKNSIEQYIQELVEGKAVTNQTILDLRREGFRAVNKIEKVKAHREGNRMVVTR